MTRRVLFACALLFPLVAGFSATITLSNAELEDKIKGGGLGKTAGVCIGAVTEFKWTGAMGTGTLNMYPTLDCRFQPGRYLRPTHVCRSHG